MDQFNSDWDKTFELDLRILEQLDHRQLPAEVMRHSCLSIVGGEIYISNRGVLTLRWARYLQQTLRQWHPDPPISAFIMFQFDDKSTHLSVPDAAFYPSKIKNGSAPIWMDWDHLDRLLQHESTAALRSSDVKGRQSKPIWRGSFDCATIESEARESGQDLVQVLSGKKRLALVNFSQEYPQLVDARLSGLSPNEQVRPWWQDPVVRSQSQWFDYDQIHMDQYFTNYQNVIVVDGIGAAFRLLDHFRNEQTVIFQESDYLQYYHRYLEPWVHFVPLAADLSDAVAKLEWVIGNPDKCDAIAKNGRRFYEEYLSWKPSMDLGRKILRKLSTVQCEVDHLAFVSKLQMERFHRDLSRE